ncbi:MAG: hypothetical protein Q8P20_06450 [bacterium]|nr:hypothetical protein [bacterium]
MQTNTLLAGAGVTGDGKISNPAIGNTLNQMLLNLPEFFFSDLISRTVGLLFVVGSLAFFFMLLWGAVSWILSGGDKAGLENAKGRITNAIVGFVLLIGTFAIVKLIETFFGIDILSIDIGPLVIQ